MSNKTYQTGKPDPYVLRMLSTFIDHSVDIRVVGGYVRDRLINRINEKSDVDFAVDLDSPEDIKRILDNAKIDYADKVLDFGTVMANIGDRRFDITPLKKSRSGWDKWRQDSEHRDFTINALYLDKGGIVYDYHNGFDHLKKKVLIAVNDNICFTKPKNVLRFFRLMAELDFKSEDYKSEVQKHAHQLREYHIVHPIYIRTEFFRVLENPNASAVLDIMQRWGALQHILLDMKHVNTNVLKRKLPKSIENKMDPIMKLSLLIRNCAGFNRETFDSTLSLPREFLNMKEEWDLYLLVKLRVSNNGTESWEDCARKHGKETLEKIMIIHGIEQGGFNVEQILQEVQKYMSSHKMPLPQDATALMNDLNCKTPKELFERLSPLYAQWLANNSNQSLRDLAKSFKGMSFN